MVVTRGVQFVVPIAVALDCTSSPLMMPGPILNVGNDTEARQIILQGMARRGWQIEDEAPGRILASLHVRRHVAKVWIEYGGRQIQFRYGGSENLDCQSAGDSCSSIHSSYNKWARNLAIDIGVELSKQRARKPPPTG